MKYKKYYWHISAIFSTMWVVIYLFLFYTQGRKFYGKYDTSLFLVFIYELFIIFWYRMLYCHDYIVSSRFHGSFCKHVFFFVFFFFFVLMNRSIYFDLLFNKIFFLIAELREMKSLRRTAKNEETEKTTRWLQSNLHVVYIM